MCAYSKLGAFTSVDDFKQYCQTLGINLPCDSKILSDADGSPLSLPLAIGNRIVGNRWAIHPMEGWDANEDGSPSEPLLRRWHKFGLSGAKVIFGGEAFAVRADGRANPRQLYYNPAHVNKTLAMLRETVINAHELTFGKNAANDMLVGLQLTHSGRFSNPTWAGAAPKIAYHHPILDKRRGIDPNDDSCVFTDEQLYELTDCYVEAAKAAQRAGFDFVDVKHCHGYLGHELLSGFDRPGDFGGSLENRSRFMRIIIQKIRAACPGLLIGVRLSVFDTVPYQPDPASAVPGKLGIGVPSAYPVPYPAFGCNRNNPTEIDLTEPIELIKSMGVRRYGSDSDLRRFQNSNPTCEKAVNEAGASSLPHSQNPATIDLLNLSAGSPYYNPHVSRPTYFPASDAYQPPEDPLLGAFRQINAVREIKERFPELPIIGTGYTYLQDFLPHVAQAVIRSGWTDMVGIGRMVLCYPEIIAHSLAGKPLDKKRICRTFSDCTTGPRNGLISGCFPLDDYYRQRPEAKTLKEKKSARRKELGGN